FGNYRRDLAQLPLRLGGTGEDGRLSRTVRAGELGAQQQGMGAGVFQESASCPAAVGGIRKQDCRTANGRESIAPRRHFNEPRLAGTARKNSAGPCAGPVPRQRLCLWTPFLRYAGYYAARPFRPERKMLLSQKDRLAVRL